MEELTLESPVHRARIMETDPAVPNLNVDLGRRHAWGASGMEGTSVAPTQINIEIGGWGVCLHDASTMHWRL